MASVVVRQPLVNRVSWGGLFAGFFFGFGVWLVLLALGAGVGLSAFDATDVRNLQGYSVGLGIWGVIAGIVAMFFAGWLAARLGAAEHRASGMLHGAAVWGLTLAVGVWAAATVVGGAASTAARTAGTAAAGAASNPGVVDQLQQQMTQGGQDGAQQQGQQGGQQRSQTAERAATAGAASAWVFFIYGVLTLGAALLGGGAGAPKERVLVTREQPLPPPGEPVPHRA